jgi:hypothetical protein
MIYGIVSECGIGCRHLSLTRVVSYILIHYYLSIINQYPSPFFYVYSRARVRDKRRQSVS